MGTGEGERDVRVIEVQCHGGPEVLTLTARPAPTRAQQDPASCGTTGKLLLIP